MKIVFYLLLQIGIIVPLSGQSNWFPPGAKWTYAYNSWGGSGINKLEVTPNDTLIGKRTYKRLLSTTIYYNINDQLDTIKQFVFVHEEDNYVYSYDPYDAFFGGEFLYDFNRVVGDTLFNMRFGGWSPSVFIVDSVGTMEINGVSLVFQDIRFEDLFEPGQYREMRVVERIGSIRSYFLHSRLVIQPFDFPSYHFRCYEDPNMGLYNPEGSGEDCDYILGIAHEHESPKMKVTIAPNPASTIVIIKPEFQNPEKIIIYDIFGRIRLKDHPGKKSELTMDISNLENGMYFIAGTGKSGEVIFTEKLIKCAN